MDAKQEIVTKKETSVMDRNGNSPADMIAFAMQSGADLDNLEKLLRMQSEWEAKEARKAWYKAMSLFKAENISIEKNKEVGFEGRSGKVGYKHATLDNVVESITPALSKYGLSATWLTNQTGTEIKVTCRITHVQGHSEDVSLSAQADNSGSKNSIQAMGSTITYLERYTLLAATGLAVKDQDNDGQSATVSKITDAQLGVLRDLLIDMGDEKSEGRVAGHFGVASLEDLPETQFKAAEALLEARKKAKEAKVAK